MTLHIGVTGTRSGMTEFQKQEFTSIMQSILTGDHVIFHHGDCVGVDAQAATIACDLGCIVECHPPIKTEVRAFHNSELTNEPRGYFARNRDIVDSSDFLIVVPWQMAWSNNGGTWYTHDYAKKTGVELQVLWPEKI